VLPDGSPSVDLGLASLLLLLVSDGYARFVASMSVPDASSVFSPIR